MIDIPASIVRYLGTLPPGTEVGVGQVAVRLKVPAHAAVQGLDGLVEAGTLVRRTLHSHARAPGRYSLANVA